jgi:anthranilate synthase component 2
MNRGADSSATVLLVDNYDSFTYNVAHLLGALGARVDVLRNDDPDLTPETVRSYDGVVIGPGPGRPAAAGRTLDAIRWALASARPLFGVCLGEQAIGEYFGGRIDHAPRLMHGKVSAIVHDGDGLFEGVPTPFFATRYHSLCVSREGFPQALRITATSDDGVVQGIAHRDLPVAGVQFHPESVLSPDGATIFANYLRSLVR